MLSSLSFLTAPILPHGCTKSNPICLHSAKKETHRFQHTNRAETDAFLADYFIPAARKIVIWRNHLPSHCRGGYHPPARYKPSSMYFVRRIPTKLDNSPFNRTRRRPTWREDDILPYSSLVVIAAPNYNVILPYGFFRRPVRQFPAGGHRGSSDPRFFGPGWFRPRECR